MKLSSALIVTITLLLAGRLLADPPVTQPGTRPATQPGLTVAILDFTSEVPGNDGLGKQIGEVLTAILHDEPGLVLVDRATLAHTLQEHEMNLTGLVDADKAVQVGKLIGAKILVTGKAFALDKSIFMTAKIIGTETGLVDGIVLKGKQGADIGDLLMQLGEKLGDRIRTAGPKLIASDQPIDPLPQLKKKLATLKLPKVEIRVTEQQINAPVVIDPPAATELRAMLSDCGFTVVDTAEINAAKAGIDVIIKGEAVSEFSGRIGNLNNSSGRVELSVVNSTDGKILYADRITSRAVDLSEQIAGKTAVQKGTHALALKILQYFADNLPAK